MRWMVLTAIHSIKSCNLLNKYLDPTLFNFPKIIMKADIIYFSLIVSCVLFRLNGTCYNRRIYQDQNQSE